MNRYPCWTTNVCATFIWNDLLITKKSLEFYEAAIKENRAKIKEILDQEKQKKETDSCKKVFKKTKQT